jgi:hypothetical protein
VFDLLAEGKAVLVDQPLTERRKAAGGLRAQAVLEAGPRRLSPATTKLADAKKWLTRVGATLDGIIAKRRDLTYHADDRTGMQKSRTIARPTAWSAAFATTRASPWSARCCSASTTADGKLNM